MRRSPKLTGTLHKRAAHAEHPLSFPASPSEILPDDPNLCMFYILECLRGNVTRIGSVFPLLPVAINACRGEGLPALLSSTTLMPSLATLVNSATDYVLADFGDASWHEYRAWLKAIGTFFTDLCHCILTEIELVAFAMGFDGGRAFFGLCNDILRAGSAPHFGKIVQIWVDNYQALSARPGRAVNDHSAAVSECPKGSL